MSAERIPSTKLPLSALEPLALPLSVFRPSFVAYLSVSLVTEMVSFVPALGYSCVEIVGFFVFVFSGVNSFTLLLLLAAFVGLDG